MASKTKVTPQKEEMPEKEGPETSPDSPLLDLSDAAVKKLIRSAKKRGYVTHDQINTLLSSEEVKSEQIEDILAKFSEMGVNVVETEEAEPEDEVAREAPEEEAESESGELVEVQQHRVPAKAATKEPTERTDDPVRMYLREMGTVELLSREGEIAIAKRIEAGREAMIARLCESPLTIQAIIIWRDELNEGKVFLRDIIDLEATYAGPDAKAMPAPVVIATQARRSSACSRRRLRRPRPPPRPRSRQPANASKARRGPPRVRPAKAISTTTIWRIRSSGCAGCRTRTSSSSSRACRSRTAQERKYKKLKDEIIAEVKSLRLNQARIDSLVEQLYEINKRLVGCEGRLMRLAESHHVAREDFLKNYLGSELDPRWLNRVSARRPRLGSGSPEPHRCRIGSSAPRAARAGRNPH